MILFQVVEYNVYRGFDACNLKSIYQLFIFFAEINIYLYYLFMGVCMCECVCKSGLRMS